MLFDGSPFRQNVVWWVGDKPEEIEDLIAGVGRHKEPLELPSPLGRDVYLPLVVGGKTTGALVARGTERIEAARWSRRRGWWGWRSSASGSSRRTRTSQALRESETLKTSLLRAISHDLTTPLTAITIQTESLRRSAAADAELREAVEGIAEETARLRRRIDNLLAMARLEAGKAKPRREPTPPADLFRAARENLPLVFAVAAGDGARRGRLSRRERRSVAGAGDPRQPDRERASRRRRRARRWSSWRACIRSIRAQVRIEVLDRGPGVPAGVADARRQSAGRRDERRRPARPRPGDRPQPGRGERRQHRHHAARKAAARSRASTFRPRRCRAMEPA